MFSGYCEASLPFSAFLHYSMLFSLFLFFFFWLHRVACGILVPRPGIQPGPHALEMKSLNPWTTREVPIRRSFAFGEAWVVEVQHACGGAGPGWVRSAGSGSQALCALLVGRLAAPVVLSRLVGAHAHLEVRILTVSPL